MARFSFRPTFTLRGRRFLGIRGWAGKPMHPPLTDVPIGAYMLAAAFDVVSWIGGDADWARDFYRAGTFALIGGVLVALALLAWTLYRSRGQYRLSGDTVHIPGHPPVKISEITEINNTLWERKGIAKIKYATASGQSGEFKLDDFVYDRTPTDQIFERIERAVAPEAAAEPLPDAP